MYERDSNALTHYRQVNEEWVEGVKVRVNNLGFWLRHHGDKYRCLYIGHDKESASRCLLGILEYVNSYRYDPPTTPPV